MNNSLNSSLLTHQLIRAVDRALRFKKDDPTSLLISICSLLGHVSTIYAHGIVNLSELDNEEQKVLDLTGNIIEHIFETRRKELTSRFSQKNQDDDVVSVHQIIGTTKQMLLDDEITHQEGLQLVGELLSTITYFQHPTIESLQEVKELEKETMNHIKEKLDLALEAIQVQQGLLSTH